MTSPVDWQPGVGNMPFRNLGLKTMKRAPSVLEWFLHWVKGEPEFALPFPSKLGAIPRPAVQPAANTPSGVWSLPTTPNVDSHAPSRLVLENLGKPERETNQGGDREARDIWDTSREQLFLAV